MIEAGLHAKGYTLIEVLLVVAILSIIAAVGAPLYGSLQNTTELDVDTNTVVQDLYQAQSFSRNELHDCAWGVSINGQVVTLFCGATYATRNITYDYRYTVPTAVTMTGLAEIDYTKMFGLPQSTGTINLSTHGKSSSIAINPKGVLEY